MPLSRNCLIWTTSVVRQSLNTLTGTRTESLMLHFNRSGSVLQNRTSNNTNTSMFSGASSKEASNQDFGAQGYISPCRVHCSSCSSKHVIGYYFGKIGNPAIKAPAISFIQLFVVSCWVVEKGSTWWLVYKACRRPSQCYHRRFAKMLHSCFYETCSPVRIG